MSVPVGFSQAPTSLVAPSAGSATPADGAEAGGEAGVFAALLAMLAPGAQPPAEAVPPIAAPVITATETPPLPDLQQTPDGKALFSAFADALKAAQAALDAGTPLDPALEKKLAEAADAIAAWFAGNLEPPAAPQVDAADAALNPGQVNYAEPAPAFMQAQIVPRRLAELGTALTAFAAQLEQAAPELAKALAQLADSMSVGDISEEALQQLGLTRSLASSSAELDQLVAALTAPKPAPAAPPPPIAAPVLDLPDTLASPAAAEGEQQAQRASLDTEIRLEPQPSKAKEEPAAPDARPASAAAKSEAPATAPVPVAATAEPQPLPPQVAVTATRAIHAAYSSPVQQVNYPQVAFEIARHFDAGSSRFQIRLDPAELGRIDVRLDLDKNGTVSAHLFVERPETLDLMQRDQRSLQQALQQAGLDGSKTSLEFSLRQNFAGADTGDGSSNGRSGSSPSGAPAVDESAELSAQSLYRGSASQGGLNLFV